MAVVIEAPADLPTDPAHVPLALARLHHDTAVDSSVRLRFAGPWWTAARRADVVTGAGFHVLSAPSARTVVARRERTLPDWVGPGLRVLVCGLNPSLYAADAGVGFARPGNRFWPAAAAAGLVTRARDPEHLLCHDRVGMTDLVKRATAKSSELAPAEYRDGAARVARLVAWLRPACVCFVGLEGWRAAVDRRAAPGWQPDGFAGVPAYVLPSTSGLNAHATLDVLTAHFARVVAGPQPDHAPDQ